MHKSMYTERTANVYVIRVGEGGVGTEGGVGEGCCGGGGGGGDWWMGVGLQDTKTCVNNVGN